MTPAKIVDSIKKRAAHFAYNRGYSDQADDFVSFVLFHLTQSGKMDRIFIGERVPLYLQSYFVDFKRHLYGRRDPLSKNASVTKKMQRHTEPIDDENDIPGRFVDTLVDIPSASTACPRCKAVDERLRVFDIKRQAVILEVKWGFTNREIAEVLGVTESRVFQIFNELKKELNENPY